MRTFSALLIAAAITLPLPAKAADMTPGETVAPRKVAYHHVRIHRHYYPRVHYGYYWWQWGWRKGGTYRSWVGASFSRVNNPYVWGPAPVYW
jgi:hypothetical protein